MPSRFFLRALLCLWSCASVTAWADDVADAPAPHDPPTHARYATLESFEAALPDWFPKLLGAQMSAVNQKQLPFRSAYSGQNSLNQHGQDTTTVTRSLQFGSQVTDGLQLYLDMDWFTGQGLHGGSGAAGFPNGEVVRAGSVNLPKKPYLARLYGQYMYPLSGETVLVERGMDQLPGHAPVEYAILKAGKMAGSDDFDLNRYANSARLQFLNFSLIDNGAWDYAADTRGYSWGVMVGYVRESWSLKYGRYGMPKQANGNRFDKEIARDHGDNLELTVKPFENDTVVRFLAYENHGRMARYTTAIAQGQALGRPPDVGTDTRPGHVKRGLGLNLEVPLADNGDTGLFFRAGWNDGKTASFAFTDIDRELSGGGQLSGVHWGREDDWVGLGLVANFLSNDHRRFFAAGGNGLLIGDGQLRHYEPEEIAEVYYNFKVVEHLRVSPDYQFINHPAYNADRGPVHILSLRGRLSL